jgi:chromosomal replication initiator protein
MADGIVTIPLPGQPVARQPGLEDDRNGRAAAGHFLAGPENRLLEPAVRGVLGRRPAPYNPLLLHGPSGTGKSHLARGLLAAWRDRFPGQPVVYTTAVDFARELADAIETQAVVDLRARYRTASLLVFEDVGRLVDKPAAQAELIHTMDAVRHEGGQIVVTATVSPGELRELAPALQSRLLAGLTVALSPPGPAARLAILRQLADLREIELAEPVAQALAEGLNGTVPELLGALVQLDVPARLDGTSIDAQAVRHWLAERNGARQPQLADVAAATARYFSLKVSELRGPSRRRPVVAARDVAMHLARSLMRLSLQQIGQYFGGRDHTTVMHACRKIEGLLKSDPLIHQAVVQLQQKLQS